MSQLFPSGGQSIGVSVSTSVLPVNTQDWSPLGCTGWTSLQYKGLKSLLQHHSSKASILWCSAFFIVQLSHPYILCTNLLWCVLWPRMWSILVNDPWNLEKNVSSAVIKMKQLIDTHYIQLSVLLSSTMSLLIFCLLDLLLIEGCWIHLVLNYSWVFASYILELCCQCTYTVCIIMTFWVIYPFSLMFLFIPDNISCFKVFSFEISTFLHSLTRNPF